MRAGLARHALRSHPASFLGPFATLVLAATVVSASFQTATSLVDHRITPAARRAVDASDVGALATVLAVGAVYLGIVVVATTMAATVARQARDIALLRAVGASPGQVRRGIAAEAVLLAVPAALLGCALGAVAGRAWLGALVAHGIVPAGVPFRLDAAAVPIAVAGAAGTALLGALVAAARPARVPPARAMSEVAAVPIGTGVSRTVLGTGVVAGAGALSVVVSRQAPEEAADASFFVLLAACVGVGLLGPTVLRVVAPPVTAVLRLLGGPERLAAENVPVLARRLSPALVPLVLALAFATVKVAAYTTATHVSGASGSAEDRWLDAGGTAVYVAFAAVAAVNALVTVTVGRRRDLAVLRLSGATRVQVLRMVGAEAAVVVVAAVVLAAAVAVLTLVPLLRATVGVSVPYLPGRAVLVGVAAVAALVLAATVLPAVALTRGRPAETVSAP